TTVDLTLDEHINVFRDDLLDDPLENVIDPSHKNFRAEATLAKITRQEVIGPNGYELKRERLILGWTRERVELPYHSRIAARIEGKSSLARLGLGVHVTAPII